MRVGFSSCSLRALEHGSVLVMPWGSCFLAYGSQARDATHVLSTGRQIFIYCATREVLEQIVSACAYLKLGTSLLRGVKGLPFFSTRVEWRVN